MSKVFSRGHIQLCRWTRFPKIFPGQSTSFHSKHSCTPSKCINLWKPVNQKTTRKNSRTAAATLPLPRSRRRAEAQRITSSDINWDKKRLHRLAGGEEPGLCGRVHKCWSTWESACQKMSECLFFFFFLLLSSLPLSVHLEVTAKCLLNKIRRRRKHSTQPGWKMSWSCSFFFSPASDLPGLMARWE